MPHTHTYTCEMKVERDSERVRETEREREWQQQQHPHGIRLAICLSQGCTVPLCSHSPPPSAAPSPLPDIHLPGLTLTQQIALLSPSSMLVLFIAFLTLFCLICFRCRFFLFPGSAAAHSFPSSIHSISVVQHAHTAGAHSHSHSPVIARLVRPIGKFHFCVLQFQRARLMNSTPFEMHRFSIGPETFLHPLPLPHLLNMLLAVSALPSLAFLALLLF